MRNLLLAALALAGLACGGRQGHTAKGDAVLAFTGRVEHGPYTFGGDDLKHMPRRNFRALSPGASAPAKFEGVQVAQLISDVLDLKRGVDTAVFHGKNGYAVPVSMIVLKQLRPILADSVDAAPVSAWRDDAVPLVLAWPNVDQPGIDTDPRMRWWWVTGVTKVEMVSWTASYGRALRVPTGASDDARLGADAFSVQCMGCHKLRGVGGTRGPDITESASKKDLGALTSVMRDHLQRVGPAWNEPSPLAVRQIAAFLHEIDVAGGRADEEPPPPEPPAGVPRTPGGGYPPPRAQGAQPRQHSASATQAGVE
jgi:hypothetical protein